MSQYKGRAVINASRPKARIALPFNWENIESWRWQRSGGPAIQEEFKGNFPDMFTIAGQLMPYFDALSIEKISGEFFKLTAAQSGEEITEIHEVQGMNFTQNKLYSLVLYNRLYALAAELNGGGGLSPAALDFLVKSIMSNIAKEVQKYKSGEQDYDEMKTNVEALFASAATDAAAIGLEFMDDLDRNGDQFLQVQYTYRHTIVIAERIFVANSGTFAGAYNNTHQIFSEAQLIAREAIPSEFVLPPSVLNINAPSEWLKQPTHSNLTTGQKRHLVTEYLSADRWSRLYYNVVA